MNKQIYNILKKQKKDISMYLLLLILSLLLSLSIPLFNGEFLDILILGKDTKYMVNFLAAYFVIGVSNIIFAYIISILRTKLSTKWVFEIKTNFLEHFRRCPVLEIQKYEYGYLNQRINQDINETVNFIFDNLFYLIVTIVQLIVVFFLVININPLIAIIFLVFAPLYFVTFYLFKDSLLKNSLCVKEDANILYDAFNEQIFHIEAYKIDEIFQAQDKKLISQFNSYFTKVLKQTKLTGIYVADNTMIITVFQIILLFYSATNVLQGKLTVGELTIINSYYAIIQNSIKYLIGYGKKRQSYKAAQYRLEELLAIEKEHDGQNIIENISCIKVSIDSLLHKNTAGLQFSIKKGEIYKLHGANGVGKTTLTKILIGLYRLNDNNMIWIDGVESRFLNYKDLRRRHVAYIPQQLFKSNITVEQFLCNLGVNLENIKLDMSEEDYIFLKSVYSKRLSNLSGGQLQKVNILGRVFPMKTVIIFDEPTAFLDNDGKEWFYLLLKRIKKKSISIVICHDDYLDNLVDGVIDMGNVNGAIEGDSDNGD